MSLTLDEIFNFPINHLEQFLVSRTNEKFPNINAMRYMTIYHLFQENQIDPSENNIILNPYFQEVVLEVENPLPFLREIQKTQLVKNIRSNLSEEIEKYWVPNPNSIVGLQYIKLKDGIISVAERLFERTDIFSFQVWNIANIFVEPNGKISIQEWERGSLTPGQAKYLKYHILQLANKEMDYILRENRFFDEKPWKYLNGMTPQQAISKLHELGW